MTTVTEPRYVVRPDMSGDRRIGWVVYDRPRNLVIFRTKRMQLARHEAHRRNWQATHR